MGTVPAIAVVFAGGVGSRMVSAEQPKQFLPVDGKPVLAHTLDHFQRHPEVAAVHLVTLATHVEDSWELVRACGADKVRTVVAGGTSAQESILQGLLSAVDDGAPDDAVVLVHDGVRPLINADLISRTIASARAHGSGITAIPCFETVAQSLDGGRTVASVARRQEMHVLQAPQTFELGPLLKANLRSLEEGLLGTFVDQAQLMQHYGEELHLVEGLRGNVKLTTDLDLLQFRVLVGAGYLSAITGEEL